MAEIFIGNALSEFNSGRIFSIGFYKANGCFETKHLAICRTNNIATRKKTNRSGLLKCYQPQDDTYFDVTIDLIVECNGLKIIRPEKND